MAASSVPAPAQTSAPERPSAGAAEMALAALLAGAGLVHVAMAPSHLGSSASDGVGFLAVGVVQLVLAAVVLTRPSRGASAAAVVVSAVAIGAWLVSRTTGLPYGSHKGVAESVTFVDGVTALLEVAALAVAVVQLVRVSGDATPHGSGAPQSRGRIAFSAVAVSALVLAVAAIASPSAREHGHEEAGAHGHGEEAGEDHGHEEEAAAGHGHGEGAADDLGYAQLVNGQMGSHEHPDEPAASEVTLTPEESGALAEQLAATATLIEAYPTVADAKAAGYRQQGPFSPGLGVHFSGPGATYNSDGDMDAEDIAGGMLIYDGIEDDARLAGFMYMAYQGEPPEGFVGDLDTWHFHTATCIVVTPDGIDTPFGADLTGITEEMCADKGGALIDFTGYMVHVWTVPGYESPEGVFSDLNPKITCPDGTYYTIETAEIGDADTTCLVA